MYDSLAGVTLGQNAEGIVFSGNSLPLLTPALFNDLQRSMRLWILVLYAAVAVKNHWNACSGRH